MNIIQEGFVISIEIFAWNSTHLYGQHSLWWQVWNHEKNYPYHTLKSSRCWTFISNSSENLLSRAPPRFGKQDKPLVSAAFTVVRTHCKRWRAMGYLFSVMIRINGHYNYIFHENYWTTKYTHVFWPLDNTSLLFFNL
jgi:hypothetical protein